MLIKRIIIGAFAGLVLGPVAISDLEPEELIHSQAHVLQIVQQTALAPQLNPETLLYTPLPEARRSAQLKRRLVVITAYSSTPDQTDDSPFITAIGTTVRDGIVAANWLPIGTYVRMPALYGEKVFVVEDRMHPKNAHKLDIWMETRQGAKEFGVRQTVVEVF